MNVRDNKITKINHYYKFQIKMYFKLIYLFIFEIILYLFFISLRYQERL